MPSNSPRRTKDPLGAATSAHLPPALRPYGFRRRTVRLIGRLTEGAFQFLLLERSSWGGGDFTTTFVSLPLGPPCDHLALEPGRRLRSTRGSEWWPSATQKEADASIREVIAAVKTDALPFFEATASTRGLYAHLTRRGSMSSNHHRELACGTCAAKLSMDRIALRHLRTAIDLYEADGRDWCEAYRNHALTLSKAIRAGSALELLRHWRGVDPPAQARTVGQYCHQHLKRFPLCDRLARHDQDVARVGSFRRQQPWQTRNAPR